VIATPCPCHKRGQHGAIQHCHGKENTMPKKKDVFKEIEEIKRSADSPGFIASVLTVFIVVGAIFLTLAIYFHD
jgi:hypothetical protein